jgi:hypothetical protein
MLLQLYGTNQKHMKANPIPSLLCRYFLVFLFVYTAVSKLAALSLFESALQQHPLPRLLRMMIVYLLPPLELMVALLLAVPSTRKAGSLLAILLLGIMTIYLGYMLVRGGHLPCACGGVIAKMGWKTHFFFNLLCIGAAVVSYKEPISVKKRATIP